MSLRLLSLYITDKTPKDKLKKQATYPDGDHKVFKQEYWDHPITKWSKHWITWKIQQTQQNKIVVSNDLLSLIECTGRPFSSATWHKQRWCGCKINRVCNFHFYFGLVALNGINILPEFSYISIYSIMWPHGGADIDPRAIIWTIMLEFH